MKKALIVGINYYARMPQLNGSINDARSVSLALERNADGTANFVAPLLILGSDQATKA